MSDVLLRLSEERIQAELRKVELATEADRFFVRRRRWFMVAGILVWFAGVVILGGAFHTTSVALGSVLLLLGPLVGTFGPLAVAYIFWATSGEI